MTTGAPSATAKSLPPLRHDGTDLVRLDPWLENYRPQLRDRFGYYKSVLSKIDSTGGLMGPISQGHRFFGFNRGELYGKSGVWYREWAPNALQLRLIGDFNHWDRFGHPLVRDQFGIWSLFLPDEKFGEKFVHGSKVKVHVVTETSSADRIPAYIKQVLQEGPGRGFVGVYWNPPQPYQFQNAPPK